MIVTFIIFCIIVIIIIISYCYHYRYKLLLLYFFLILLIALLIWNFAPCFLFALVPNSTWSSLQMSSNTFTFLLSLHYQDYLLYFYYKSWGDEVMRFTFRKISVQYPEKLLRVDFNKVISQDFNFSFTVYIFIYIHLFLYFHYHLYYYYL